MNEINSMLQDLMDYSKEYNMDEIDKEELNLKLGLLSERLQRIEINYNFQPLDTLDERVKLSFNQLLFRTRYKAVSSINSLMATTSKRSFNAKVRRILATKLFFNSLYSTMDKNIKAYVHRNQLRYYKTNYQIFIIGGNENE